MNDKPATQIQNPAKTLIVAITASVISGAAIQLAAALIWGGAMMVRLDQAEIRSRENMALIVRLEERGYRGIPVIEQQIKDLRERNDRIIQALDSTYNTLNEHIRTGSPDIQRMTLLEERLKNIADRTNQITERINVLERHIYGRNIPTPLPAYPP